MKTKDINKQIDVVAAKAKALNTKASDRLHLALANAGFRLQETAEKVAESAEELAIRAQAIAKEISPKPVRKQIR
jgi:hypothetical protein